MVPCAILDGGDDAAAIEASLIENLARLDPDEVTQWETFTRLVRAGISPADIAANFGLPDLMVRRILALGNLLPRIRQLYTAERIDRATVRHLTMASKNQQRAWLALLDNPDAYVPKGYQLKAWLFGGLSIRVNNALFDVEAYTGEIVADLFGEDRYFADPDQFWIAQKAAIETRRGAYIADGWADVVILSPGQTFQNWDHEKTPKRKGGRIYVDVHTNGEVTFHEGYLTRKEARHVAAGGPSGPSLKAPRPEISGPMQTYVDLHRHAAVRARLLDQPRVALRLMIAHAVGGSPLWTLRAEPQTSRNDAIRDSLAAAPAEATFATRRRTMLEVLDLSPGDPTLTGHGDEERAVARIFLRLLDLPDPAVMDMVTVVMAETLSAGSDAVEATGVHLRVDLAAVWQAGKTFLDLVRDREILLALLEDIAGATVARAYADATPKTLKGVIRDHLDGTNGRTAVSGWVPRWMRFPPSAYTERGGVGSVAAHARVTALHETMQAATGGEPATEPAITSASDTPEHAVAA